ncbi:pantoate--beta-alanine ligase [Hyphomicrobium sp. 99]|uniref:pantoate--beta-alanine ligase n=1 Tax=Hyphomicrobium sp. 99 TaxID=1163419 RepID=UPI0005F820D9|nr:pantoate--beta-alanine ligase [Hyphomicrobium sp. 99]
MSEIIKVVRNVRDLRKATSKWRQRGQSIALVPTMGALHAGHLALVKLARKKADRTVVSIFVNPTQFGPNEDLSRYPRDEAGDLQKLADADADLVWAPDVEEMYPEGFSAGVRAGSAGKDLEGEFRPFHFDGVATVCTKLFNQVTPDIAIFGEKDYQQLAVLKQVVRDLNMPLKVIGAPTKRDSDGLALSSRNAYLSDAERKIAPALNAVISALAEDVANGADVASGIANAKRKLAAAGFTKIDYVEVRDAETLAVPPAGDGRDLRVLAAVWLGKTRLIDNVAV